MAVYDYKTKKNKNLENAAAAAAANNNTIAVNPYGVTQGKYGSYSYGTMPTSNSQYDKSSAKTLTKIQNYGNYKSPVQTGLNKYANLITNPGEFNSEWKAYRDKYGKKLEEEYDPNSDANYLAYKNQYLAGGQKAMQDTLAKAAALTGGFGSSYGQSAAQQTYGEYAAALANKIPELAQAAYEMNLSKLNAYNNLYGQDWDMYNDDRSYNMNALNTLSGLDNNYYSRWSGERDNLYNLLSAYEGLDDRDYSRFKDEYSMWKNAYSDLTKGSGGSGGGGRSGSGSDNDKTNTPDTIVNNHSLEGGWVDIPEMGKQSLSSLERLVNEGKVIETKTKNGYVYSPAPRYETDSKTGQKRYGSTYNRVRYAGLQ